jgi:hypothetical protein
MLLAALVLFGLLPAIHAVSHGSAHSGPPLAALAAPADEHDHHACTGHDAPSAPIAPTTPLDSSCHTCVELLLASTLTSPGLSIDWAAPTLEVAGLTPDTFEGVLVARAIALSHARGPPIA